MDPHAAAHSTPQQPLAPGLTAWPVVVATATVILGLALLWWGRDTSDQFAWPFLGAAIVTTAVAVGAWVADESRSRQRWARLGDRARPARQTQVITFAIAEGRIEAARTSGGVLEALSRSDSSLRALPGFQDIRVVVSPASSGPSQALCETTWWDRGALATYDRTRQTVLDLLNSRSDQVVPGSVQVFDMEVVHDPKEVSVRLGVAAATGLLAVVIAGGFAIGAGLSTFAESTTTSAPPAADEPASSGAAISASGSRFDASSLEATAGTEFAITFRNKESIPHNIHFYDRKDGQTLAPGAEGKIIKKGASETLKFTVPTAGAYFFQCDVHPDQMKGTFIVK